jgi:hypothetical protein
MKDQFYLYYHCVRNNIFLPLYECLSYDDPFDIPKKIPKEDYDFSSVIVPVHRWIPSWYHQKYILKQIRNIFQVQIKQD